jgi:KDO2-lipid IV(A) lauroyltransferase
MNPVLALFLRLPTHGLGLLVFLLPRRAELALGRLLGRLALAADRKRPAIARENLRNCLPELSAAEREALLRANYEHYGMLVLELGHMLTPVPGHWLSYVRRWTRVEGFDRGKGTLFFGAHLANWELMACGGAQAGVPITMATRHLKPAWLDRWMQDARLAAGVRCVYQPRTMPAVMKALRAGAAIGFVLDQYMVPPMGQKLKFFGVTVDTLAVVAPLARRTGAGVVPVRQRRDPGGVIVLTFEPEVPLEGTDEEFNQLCVDRVEAWIRERPSEWLWAHRRFKHVDWSERDRKA